MKHLVLLAAAVACCGVLFAPSTSGAAPVSASGKAVFDASCAQCHVTTSTDTKIGPGLKGLFKNKTLPGTGRPTTVANVSSQIRNGGGGMPAFGDMSAADLNALIAYLKTL